MLVGPSKCLRQIIQIKMAITNVGEDLKLGLNWTIPSHGGTWTRASELQVQRSNRLVTLSPLIDPSTLRVEPELTLST